MVKVMDSIQYHVWTDALHARQLARTTASDYDRGAYIRWTIQTAWTAFETVSDEALDCKLGMRFREIFDRAVADKNLPPVDWSRGIWQQVLRTYSDRKKFTHVVPSIAQEQLCPDIQLAELAIVNMRAGITAVVELVGRPRPVWVDDDDDRGWKSQRPSTRAYARAVHDGADENSPDIIKIAYVSRGQEHVCDIAPPNASHSALLDALVPRLTRTDVEAIKAYRGTTLLEERPVKIRG